MERNEKGYEALKRNLIDIVAEEQAKLGYRKEMIRLYYPLSSLNIRGSIITTPSMLVLITSIALFVFLPRVCRVLTNILIFLL